MQLGTHLNVIHVVGVSFDQTDALLHSQIAKFEWRKPKYYYYFYIITTLNNIIRKSPTNLRSS